jgi:hypothetical protein
LLKPREQSRGVPGLAGAPTSAYFGATGLTVAVIFAATLVDDKNILARLRFIKQSELHVGRAQNCLNGAPLTALLAFGAIRTSAPKPALYSAPIYNLFTEDTPVLKDAEAPLDQLT